MSAARLTLTACIGRCLYCRGMVTRSTARWVAGTAGKSRAVHRWHEVRSGEVPALLVRLAVLSSAEGGVMTRNEVGPAGAVTVEIQGVTAPATFPNLLAAVDAVWESLRALPLGSDQYEAYKLLLGGPDAVERVARLMERDGRFEVAFTMAGRSHLVRVGPPDDVAAG